MATYAIGDIQGCYRTLERLLAQCRFDHRMDRIWLVGDLVNRGPRSLEVLRWARGLGDRLVTVLGNHDLHLVGRAMGLRKAKKADTLDPVLDAPDARELIEWLRSRPFLHRDGRFLLVHAGLQPAWDVDDAETEARQLQAMIAGARAPELLRSLRHRGAPAWSPDLPPAQRMAIALQTLVLMRTCGPDGRLCQGFTGPPEAAPPGCRPWFDSGRWPQSEFTIVCGHWAALGLRSRPNLLAIDTGCVWGGRLTAVRLEDRALFQVELAD
jgi:bis(5'-nucleosyl)-tetraphosphatase (symmetrical)